MHDGREFSSTAQGNSAQERGQSERGPQARPLRLPRMPEHWARWCTALFGAGLHFPVNVGGRVWTWRPVWLSAWQHPAPARWACALHGSVGAQPFTCWLDSAAPLAVPPLTEEDLSPAPPSPLSGDLSAGAHLPQSPLPEALLAAVMQDVTAATLAQLGAALGQQVTLHSLRCTPEDALALEEALPFTLTLADTPNEVNGADEADETDTPNGAGGPNEAGVPDMTDAPQGVTTTVHGLLAAEWPHPLFTALYQAAQNAVGQYAVGQYAAGQNDYDWQEAALPSPLPPLLICPLLCPIVWRTRPLALADIRALEAGDVLLMPCMADADTLPVQMQVGLSGETGHPNYFAARWCAAQRTVTLETAMQQDRTDYEANAAPDLEDAAGLTDISGLQDDDASPSSADVATPATWDQCRVPLQCRLGEVSVTLAELSTLAPGAVLPALDSVEAPVSLWLGATRIGRGALVDVDGRIGVRITEIIAAAHKG